MDGSEVEGRRAGDIPGRGGVGPLRSGLAAGGGVLAAAGYLAFQLVVEQKLFLQAVLGRRLGNGSAERLPLGFADVLRLKLVMALQQLAGRPEALKDYQFAVYERIDRRLAARGVEKGRLVQVDEYRADALDPRVFYRRHVRRGRPAVIRDLLTGDLDRFRFSALARQFPDAVAQVLDTHDRTIRSATFGEIALDGGTRLLPQQALVDQDPALVDRLPIERSRDFFPVLGRRARPVATFLIIGLGRGLNANFHCEEGPNWYMAISGTKHWTLVDAEHSFLMYPSARGDGMRRFSEFPAAADGDPADEERFPLVGYAPRVELDLHAGDALFFPAWTWHKTLNLDAEGLGVTCRYAAPGPMANRYFRALQLISPPFWRSIARVVAGKLRGDTDGLEESNGFNEQELALM